MPSVGTRPPPRVTSIAAGVAPSFGRRLSPPSYAMGADGKDVRITIWVSLGTMQRKGARGTLGARSGRFARRATCRTIVSSATYSCAAPEADLPPRRADCDDRMRVHYIATPFAAVGNGNVVDCTFYIHACARRFIYEEFAKSNIIYEPTI